MNFGFHSMQETSSPAENSAPWKVSRYLSTWVNTKYVRDASNPNG
jgi:hypothetical protein